MHQIVGMVSCCTGASWGDEACEVHLTKEMITTEIAIKIITGTHVGMELGRL
jgi:hypothetical protein